MLNNLLDPALFSVDRGQLHILLHHSKSLSEFDSLVRDIESTLSEVLDSDADIADMYLSHIKQTGLVCVYVCHCVCVCVYVCVCTESGGVRRTLKTSTIFWKALLCRY